MSMTASVAQQWLDLSRRIDHHVLVVDQLPPDPATGKLPVEDETIVEVRAALTAAREACDLLAGAYMRITVPGAQPRR